MYSPIFYREKRATLIHDLIQEVGFATVLTEGHTDLISHLPIQMVFDQNGRAELMTHCARANPHWRELQKVGRAKLIFNGPHAYISPSWYPPAEDNVPTWNYAVVHAVGNVEIIEEQAQVVDSMAKFVSHFEAHYKTGWTLPINDVLMADMMNGIRVFKIKDVEFEAKFKLSQKQEPAIRDNVIQKLESSPETASLAGYMKKTTPPSQS
jgi:transcriptional regulator